MYLEFLFQGFHGLFLKNPHLIEVLNIKILFFPTNYNFFVRQHFHEHYVSNEIYVHLFFVQRFLIAQYNVFVLK
jgi:hypothetical protein